MTNKWIEYIETEATKNNISYGCALSNKDIINNYKKVTKKTKADKDIIKKQIITNQTLKLLKDKDEFKNKNPKYYNKLFN